MRVGVIAALGVGVALGLGAPEAAAVKQRCEAYQEQFDSMREREADNPQFPIALRYRRLGERYCNTAQTASGQKVLRHAIELLGASPRVK